MAARGNPLGGMLDADEIAKGKVYVARAEAGATEATPAREGPHSGDGPSITARFPTISPARAPTLTRWTRCNAAYPDDADIAAFDVWRSSKVPT